MQRPRPAALLRAGHGRFVPHPTLPRQPEVAHTMVDSISVPQRSRWMSLLFAVLVGSLCVFALTLPIFPTQDGGMHKYYVYTASQILHHSPLFAGFQFKHPLPPYATYYAALLGLSHFMSLDMAEKILICFCFILLAYGFRFAARALGPGSEIVSLCVMPLLLNWGLMMGFLNFVFGIGIFFFAYGAWLRAAAGQTRWWIGFVVLVLLLTLTHPLPLMTLLILCALDLGIRAWQTRVQFAQQGHNSGWLRSLWPMAAGVLVTVAALAYPALLANHKKTESMMRLFGLHPHVLVKALALYGVSPFETRSLSPSINVYRFGLYATILGALWAATRGLRTRFQDRALRPSDTMLIAAVLLAVLIPVIPPELAGGYYFSARMLIFVWLGALAAAASYWSNQPWFRRGVPAFAIFMVIFTIVPGEQYLRPIANQYAAIENEPLPSYERGMVLFDGGPLYKIARYKRNVAFDPYLWTMALPFIKHHDVMIDSPWLDEANIPIGAQPGTVLLTNETAHPTIQQKYEGQLNWLKSPNRAQLVAHTEFILFAGSPEEMKAGMQSSLNASDAQHFQCNQRSWYEVCFPRGPLDVAELK